jgi:glycosyltransferase involved in cell wall biosynthesis
MLSAPTSNMHTTESAPRILIISGVDITSARNLSNQQNPTLDYELLKDILRPDIIDTQVVQKTTNPVIAAVRRMLGLPWSIAMSALVRAHRYNVIIATGEDVGLRLAFLLKILRRDSPLVITCHNISTRRPSFFLGRLKVGSAVRTFQCLSLTQSRMLIERFGVSEKQIQLLYWHIDHNFFHPMPEATVRNQICSAGMASRDYATLVAAARDIDVDVKIAADSPWFKQELNIPSNQLLGRVEVRSYGTYYALRQLYAESLFVVIPLFDVPFSAGYTVILEAMAMGKAVIVSKIKQKDDFIEDGWNGLYVTPGDVSELHRQIEFLLKHPDEARRLGSNARKKIEERFTLEHYGERMRSAVTEIVNPSG